MHNTELIPLQAQLEQKTQEIEQQSKGKELNIHKEEDKYLSATTPAPPSQATQPQPQDTQEQSTKIPTGHNPFFVIKNTGIDYFDKKKNITLFDALIAKNLGVDLRKTYIKNDITLDADIKARQIQGSDVAKRQKQLAEVTKAVLNHAKNIQEGAGVLNGASRWLNDVSKGLINISDTNQKIMANETTLGTQLVDLLVGSRSTEKERNKLYDLVKFYGRSEGQIASNLTELLKLIRDNYVQNLQDFSNRGFTPSVEMIEDLKYIEESIATLQKQGKK